MVAIQSSHDRIDESQEEGLGGGDAEEQMSFTDDVDDNSEHMLNSTCCRLVSSPVPISHHSNWLALTSFCSHFVFTIYVFHVGERDEIILIFVSFGLDDVSESNQ